MLQVPTSRLLRPGSRSIPLRRSALGQQRILCSHLRSRTPPINLGRTAMEEAWQAPDPQKGWNCGLKVYNSLTRSKVDFTPRDGKKVTWYNCGPTVYDASHMGHARNYVSQDVLRRITKDYFGYDVHFVMNVTDIDDKIIERSRQEHLFSSFLSSSTSLTPRLLNTVQDAFDAYFSKNIGKLVEGMKWEDVAAKAKAEPTWRSDMIVKEEKFGMWLDALSTASVALATARAALSSGNNTDAAAAAALLYAAQEPVSKHLDSLQGSALTDPSLSANLAKKWEKAFFEDMKRLNVLEPDTLTRVTEYVDQILKFVEQVVQRGYAYERNGSVYFDVANFDGAIPSGSTDAWTHAYAKLQPGSKSNLALVASGEGFASSSSEKRHPADFALWKRSKPGEPSWPSGWGPGRPGWHIECSVMASEVLGDGMDVHSGGVDLMFPHHDNEIAQSEAYHNCRQWVNYFLHTGHLHIEGLKMSKSLKNFITIEDALSRNSARQLRLAFLGQRWDLGMDFAESAMAEVRTQEATFSNFFALVKALAYERLAEGDQTVRTDADLALELEAAQASFRAALCDSFNTPDALKALLGLVTSTHKHLTRPRVEVSVPGTVTDVASWVSDMLVMFGLADRPKVPADAGEAGKVQALGWNEVPLEGLVVAHAMVWSGFRDRLRAAARAGADTGKLVKLAEEMEVEVEEELGISLKDGGESRSIFDFTQIVLILATVASVMIAPVDELRPAESRTLGKSGKEPARDTVLTPHIRAWTAFRAEVLELATKKGQPKEFLALCDRLRDQDLVDLGVALDDQEDGRAMAKLLPAESLIRAREDRATAAREKAARQAAQQQAAEAKRLEKLMKGKTSPGELFKPPASEEYGQWDADGVPTHDKDGQEVSKARRKKLVKEWEVQKKAHGEYLRWQASQS